MIMLLHVEAQEVGLTESADRCLIIDTIVRPMPVVAVKPSRQLVPSVARVFISVSISPFAQAGLDEALSLAVGLGCIGLGANVAKAETFTCSTEGEGVVAGAIVGHHAHNLDAEAFVVGERGLEMTNHIIPL
jgi:hypothetical protein